MGGKCSLKGIQPPHLSGLMHSCVGHYLDQWVIGAVVGCLPSMKAQGRLHILERKLGAAPFTPHRSAPFRMQPTLSPGTCANAHMCNLGSPILTPNKTYVTCGMTAVKS